MSVYVSVCLSVCLSLSLSIILTLSQSHTKAFPANFPHMWTAKAVQLQPCCLLQNLCWSGSLPVPLSLSTQNCTAVLRKAHRCSAAQRKNICYLWTTYNVKCYNAKCCHQETFASYDGDDDDDVMMITTTTTMTTTTTTTAMIALTGTMQVFVQPLHCAVNCLQHVRSCGPGAIVCKSRATQWTLITCSMSCATWYKGTSQLLSLTDFKLLYLIDWND